MSDRTTAPAPKSAVDPISGDADRSGNGSEKSALAAAAWAAARRMIGAQQGGGAAAKSVAPASSGGSAHPMLEAAGQTLGVGLGVIVTEALRALPSWNQPVLDDKGQPVASVPGAERVGDHDILKRHEEVVGPKIAALVDQLPPGAVHDLVAGFGAGATEAPGDSYRLEAYVSDLLQRHGGQK